MSFPTALCICGRTFGVETRSYVTSEADNLGTCNTLTQTIFVSSDIHPEHQAETLLHETLEAINHACDLQLSHPQIATLSACLYAVLKDNEAWW